MTGSLFILKHVRRSIGAIAVKSKLDIKNPGSYRYWWWGDGQSCAGVRKRRPGGILHHAGDPGLDFDTVQDDARRIVCLSKICSSTCVTALAQKATLSEDNSIFNVEQD